MAQKSVAIIGAGVGGIAAAYQLRRQLDLKDITIFDMAPEVGGTWWNNQYPGCSCDVPSHIYSFSFAINPNWTMKYSPQAEILEYVKGVVEKFNLRPLIQFETEVLEAKFLVREAKWKLTIRRLSGKDKDRTQEVFFDILLNGTGILRYPNIPQSLIENFKGDWLHSSQWHKGVQVKGKKVAVIGTGTSAAQIIPSIAPDVSDLYVYQRTPGWVMPRNNYRFWNFVKLLFAYLPFLAILFRLWTYLSYEFLYVAFTKNKYLAWLGGRLASSGANEMLKQVESPALRKMLTPTYEIGCKRLIFSNDFLPAFNRPNVHLITTGISSISGRSITTEDGTRTDVDLVVLATGFHPGRYVAPMKVIGSEGKDINDYWGGNPKSFYGMTCPGFPNCFMLLGPNSALGHNSVLFMMECQIELIVRVIRHMMQRGSERVEPAPHAVHWWNDFVKQGLKSTVFNSGTCKSWYKTDDGEVHALWPRTCTEFWFRIKNVPMSDFMFK